ncbi:hypothetical protein OAS95_02025 [Pelagibacteraceae bacterium]|jgi:hypothetical protein|nr:hypothetical protein [Pelagibacteraceae bacterium]
MDTPTTQELNDEINALRQQVSTLKTRLSKYTNNERHKKYYENNKDKVKQNAKLYIDKLKEENPDKLKEYRKRAYMNRKQKEKD